MRSVLLTVFLFAAVSGIYPQSGWVNLNSGVSYELRGMHFLDVYTGWVVGFSANVIKTTDGGSNWIVQNTSWNQGFISVFFQNQNTGWISGGRADENIAVIQKTTNGGINWNMVFYGNIGCVFNESFINPTTGWFSTGAGYVINTTDAGMTFTTKYIAPYAFVGINFINQNTGWVAGLSGKIFKTIDGGLNWIEQPNSITSNLHSVSMRSSTTGFIAGYNGTFLKTTNGGNNWIPKPIGNSYWINHIQFLNNNTGYICGGDYSGSTPLIMVTTNSGENWFSQSVPVSYWIGRVQFLNQNTGFAAGKGGKILKTTTGGYSVPAAPVLVSPANNSINVTPTPTLIWNASAGATQYKVEISTVPLFNVISDSATLISSTYNVPAGKLSAGYTYYWRVKSSNQYGSSIWSSVWNFSTSVTPPAPVLFFPTNGYIGTTQTPMLIWGSVSGAQFYKVQVSTVPDFAIIIDSASISTTSYTIPGGKIQFYITYYWRVQAGNSFGYGPFSNHWWFISQPDNISGNGSEIPDKFNLYQNYPNPFNPETKINFDIAENSNVKLSVYDMSGRLVYVLVDHKLNSGKYSIGFSGKDIGSGVYFARLETPAYSSIIRMILIK